jgi:membrane associated rhomboid family serine protease
MSALIERFSHYTKKVLASPATVAITAVNLVVFAMLQARPDLASLFLLNPTLDAVAAQPWTLFTVFFSHELAVHLLLNMALFLVFGVKLEKVSGPLAAATTYVIAGLLGSLSILATAPFLWDGELIPGASAAVFGTVAAFAMLRPNDIVLRSKAPTWAIALFAANLALALSSPLTRVGAAGHAVGIVVGLACGYVIKRMVDSRSE